MKLIVTEKEKMAEIIAKAIGNYTRRLDRFGRARPIRIYFTRDYTIFPLSGHIMGYVTARELERWSHSSVDAILNEPKSLQKIVIRRGYYGALRSLGEKATEIIIATDSDEEGENIGLEVLEILGPFLTDRKPVRRLWLTTTVPSDIIKSLQTMRSFNFDLARSVEARRKLDAMVGFSGSREITLSFRRKIGGGQGFLSFGRVQTSTLWLLVQREREIRGFAKKKFWDIIAQVKSTKFSDIGNPFFDHKSAFDIYERIRNNKEFQCSRVDTKTSSVQPPKPLNTAEMLKVGSNILKLPPSKILSLAEELYLSSYISYPRVENQVYRASFDHKQNLEKLKASKFNDYISILLSKNMLNPTRGKFSEDHDPITPIASYRDSAHNPPAYKLYEIILRHYLSVFGPPALFLNTNVEGNIQGESFRAEGRRIVERGFYAIYYYPPRENPIQDFQQGRKYLVENLSIVEGETEPPHRYTQSSLLGRMEEEGIGTKTTRPAMIEVLKDRGYATIERFFLKPTERGMKLIETIEGPWGNYISPEFTSRVEKEMEKVANGLKDWEELVQSERKTFADAIATMRKSSKSVQR